MSDLDSIDALKFAWRIEQRVAFQYDILPGPKPPWWRWRKRRMWKVRTREVFKSLRWGWPDVA